MAIIKLRIQPREFLNIAMNFITKGSTRITILTSLISIPSSTKSHLWQKKIKHSADRSIKLSGSHRTHTQTSEVRWTVRSSGHWVVASMFAYAIPKGPSKRQLRKTSNARRSQLNQYWSYEPHSNFKPTWNFFKILYVSFKWYFWQK